VPQLKALGAKVQAFDPEGMGEAKHLLDGVELVSGPYDAAFGADALVILTEWDQFRALDLDRVKQQMKGRVIVDLRNIYQPAEMRDFGFTYVSVGRS
jgi:UDPglucose 6-dehydrogenase